MTDDQHAAEADLVYAGRERKRPPGASDLVQRIYILLHEHSEGMTRDDLWEALREGWLETDAYRAYDHYLAQRRNVYHQTADGDRHKRGVRPAEYGTDLFKQRAQKWWISEALSGMTYRGSARREGKRGNSRWFAGRPPFVATQRPRASREPLDVAAARSANRADTQAHVRREQIKARLLEDLSDPKNPGYKNPKIRRLLETVRLAHEYLSGR